MDLHIIFCAILLNWNLDISAVFSLDELHRASTALHNVLELDLPKMQNGKPGEDNKTSVQPCDRCGRYLYASED